MDEPDYVGDDDRQPMTSRQARYVQDLCGKRGVEFNADMTRGEAHAFIRESGRGWLTRTQVREARCPKCGARPGRPCADGRVQRKRNHVERIRARLAGA